MANISTFLHQQLRDDETVSFIATISKKPLLAYLIVTIALCFLFSLMGRFGYIFMVFTILAMLFQCIVYTVYSISSEFVVTNQRVIGKTGLISRNTLEIPLEQGEGLVVNQSLFGRVFGYGNIASSGTGTTTVAMLYLDHPFVVRKQILEAKCTAMHVANAQEVPQ
ncbi:PH domain-containing protein [Vibrio vulnificus]|uniref:PH domain-containing protein n=1 Tax=Vibrio vulnificus TaxID=672 RepID=UPI001EEC3808|nr:PH domain-containing protein [Vibrio vulnificus]MCG6303628.1 PH domain-containing protein [Vibrio vulnificus]